MAQRLWPRAWALFFGVIAVLFGLLEEAGFRRELHLTLSRWTARFPHAAITIAVAGPVASWIYALHIRKIQKETSCPQH
jgi:hypothetical protein